MNELIEQRRGERSPVEGEVGFRKPRELPYEVDLRELSQHGCRIAVRERVRPGQFLWVTLPGIEMQQSWVRWCDEWMAGVEFERPMHVSVYEHMVRQLEAA